MEIYFHARTRECDYEHLTQEWTKYTVAYPLSFVYTFFRRLYTNFDDCIQLQMSI